MKKTILALTIPALFATSVSAVEIYSDEEGSKIDLYGRLQYDMGSFGYQPNGDADNFGGQGKARVGFNVDYNLNQDVDLIGKYEAQIRSENKNTVNRNGSNDDVSTRYAWLGFRFQDTTDVTFGKSEAPRALLTDLTDTFDIFGGTVTNATGFNRVDDQIRLAYAANGFDVRAAYSFSDSAKFDGNGGLNYVEHDSNGNPVNNTGIKNRYGIAAGYTLPINLGFVASFDRTDYGGDAEFQSGLGSRDNNTDWGLGVHYTIDGFYFAGLYGQRNFDYYNAENGGNRYWELQAAYNVENWTLTADYENQKGRKADSSGARADLQKVDQYTLGARYAFTPKTRVFAEYVINDVSGKDDLYGVGIQYNF